MVRETTMENKKIVCFNERLGDRIIVKYFAENVKTEFPEFELYAFQSFKYPSVKGFDMELWAPDLFAGFLYPEDGYRSCLDAENKTGYRVLYPTWGNLFVYAPNMIRKTGRYPTLEIPDRYKQWLDTEFDEMVWRHYCRFAVGPPAGIVVWHILTDAPYSRSRNHNFKHHAAAIKMLARKYPDWLFIRIGRMDAENGLLRGDFKNIIDLTQYDLTPSRSISVISRGDIYVGGDTGMTHAASALKKKIVAIWGDITHMLRDRSTRNNIQPGDWNSGPYVPEEDCYILRRNGGEHIMRPIYTAEEIVNGVEHFIKR